MESDPDWQRIADAEQVAFLAAKLPKNFELMHNALENTFSCEQEENQLLKEEKEKKRRIQDEIDAIKARREDLYKTIDDLKYEISAA